MLQTLALAAALSLAPAQNSPLALTNDRVTFGGEHGPARPNTKYLPGDIFLLAFDIENLVATPNQTVKYSIGMVVSDANGREVIGPDGKPLYSSPPGEQEVRLPLGGTKLPANAYVLIQPNQSPGTLVCTVSVTDKMTNATKTLSKQFEVLPAAFGTVGLFLSYDSEGKAPAPLLGRAGQGLWLNFGVIGIGRDPQTKQTNVVAEMRVFDQAGKPTQEQPYTYFIDPKMVSEKDLGVYFRIGLPLNRAGQFTVELKTECKVTGKTYKMSFPITVMQAQ